MTSIAELVSRMARMGAPAEAIAIAVEALDAQRGRDRERKRRSRNVTGHSLEMSRNFHGISVDKESFPAPLQRNNLTVTDTKISKDLTEKQVVSTELVEGRKRGTRMVVDWQPREQEKTFARIECHLDDAKIEFIRDEYVDFWIGVPGQRGVKLDWNATFRNRLRAIAQRGKSNGSDRQKHDVGSAALRLAEQGFQISPRPKLLDT